MADIEKQTVDMVRTTTNTESSPTFCLGGYRPAAHGATGMRWAYDQHPAHNLREITQWHQPTLSTTGGDGPRIFFFYQGPDFPTGGKIMGTAASRPAYATGHGESS